MSVPRDAAVPPGLEPAGVGLAVAELAPVLAHLTASAPSLRELSTGELLTAWDGAIAALLDPRSAESRPLLAPSSDGTESLLAVASRLSTAGLEAALDAMLGGLRRPAADRLADSLRAAADGPPPAARAVYLAGNVPGLAPQPLLPGPLERRPILLKSSSAEPFFAPALVSALATRSPVLAGSR